ncbi:MAG: hypothetical protein FXV80_04980 [Candidatus Thioglobus sp.]|nr:MAG: hypothetical protein FXV80_04980 [Candidatus Thioglobus sp.]
MSLQREQYLAAFGVPDFLYASLDKAKIAAKISTKCLIIESQKSNSFCQTGTERDFLLKILSAIGVDKSEIECVNIKANDLADTLDKYDAKAVLLMNEDLKPTAEKHFYCHHPSHILTNEPLKRAAWEVLKKVQKWLK